MTTKSIKLIVFIVLLIHGIGHFQGVVASMGVKINKAKPAHSWLLKGQSDKLNRAICFVLFLATGVMGILAALSFKGVLLPQTIWQSFTLVTAFLSTICFIMFPNGFAMFFNKVGAVAVNVIIYYSILFHQYWPAVLFED